MPIPNLAQLQRAVTIAEQIEKLKEELSQLFYGSSSVAPKTSTAAPVKAVTRKRKMSAATIAKMRASQQARWAKKEVISAVNTVVQSTTKLAKKAKRKLSPEGRARIVAALKARWAAKKTKS